MESRDNDLVAVLKIFDADELSKTILRFLGLFEKIGLGLHAVRGRKRLDYGNGLSVHKNLGYGTSTI